MTKKIECDMCGTIQDAELSEHYNMTIQGENTVKYHIYDLCAKCKTQIVNYIGMNHK